MNLFLNILIIILFSFSFSEDDDEKLIFVVTHFRHGSRAPQRINDSFIDLVGEKWTNPGELTEMGKRMHYLLGLRNRKRYVEHKQFLSEAFDPHEILIYSSLFNRTLVSVSSQLQGLYPQIAQKGGTLSPEQMKLAYPQVDCSEIEDEINKLGNNSLPNYMMLAPIKMINHNERKIIIFDIPGCTEEREEVKKKNMESLQILKDFVSKFNNKYGSTLNDFLGDSSKTYEMSDIVNICDAFLTSYTDARELTSFKKTGINLTEFYDICIEYHGLYFYYQYYGDDEKVLAHLETSKLMAEFIYYMKQRVDADIKNENITENYKDYSRPKMLMLSGHDSTLSSHEVFLIDALGLNFSYYRIPKYASQMAFEVTRGKDGPKSSYSDYTVHYYFNDEEIYNITLDNFISKIEPHIWTDEQINEFCGFDEDVEDNSQTNNNTNSSTFNLNNFFISKKKDNSKKAYKALMIVFIVLTAVLLALSLFLGIKLAKQSGSYHAQNLSTTKI